MYRQTRQTVKSHGYFEKKIESEKKTWFVRVCIEKERKRSRREDRGIFSFFYHIEGVEYGACALYRRRRRHCRSNGEAAAQAYYPAASSCPLVSGNIIMLTARRITTIGWTLVLSKSIIFSPSSSSCTSSCDFLVAISQ